MSGTPEIVIYGFVFACAVLVFQLFIGLGRQASVRVRTINNRMKRLSREDDGLAVMTKWRQGHGLSDGGDLQGAVIWLNALVLHSGLPLGGYKIYAVMAGSTVVTALFLGLLKAAVVWALIGAVIGLIAPIAGLKFFVKRRRNKAVSQLPQALDIIIRSLGAGHPVPVAMALVGREMPDPIGSEFGIASDEISYGSSLSESIGRLSARVGHEDFDLFAAMIRLQERTGGNLAELLRKNAETIRDRQKMRMKIKAASAEGRMSAMILNLAPIGLFLLIRSIAPDFYGDIADRPIVRQAFIGVVIWMIIGNLVMRKMINFKI